MLNTYILQNISTTDGFIRLKSDGEAGSKDLLKSHLFLDRLYRS